jgi:cell division protein FtsZ
MTKPPTAPMADPFQPAAPEDVRRPGSRRMPELDDFPPVGQREFQAKAGRYAGPPTLPGAPQSRSSEIPDPPARSGLLQRMMGSARKDDSSVRGDGPSDAPKGGQRLSSFFSRSKA